MPYLSPVQSSKHIMCNGSIFSTVSLDFLISNWTVPWVVVHISCGKERRGEGYTAQFQGVLFLNPQPLLIKKQTLKIKLVSILASNQVLSDLRTECLFSNFTWDLKSSTNRKCINHVNMMCDLLLFKNWPQLCGNIANSLHFTWKYVHIQWNAW